MKTVELRIVAEGNGATLYSMSFDDNELTEYEKFLTKFKNNATYNRDFNKILVALGTIIDFGALERRFRVEGKMKDKLCALSIDSRKLRLYCLRISDKILIAGNGGIKDTRTYQENPELNGYVMDLQAFDILLKEAQENGDITIEENKIVGIEDIVFEL